ncbi:MAG: hypothetical protein L6E13_03035 [Firmicutes bacterium]|nr:hypothetical protein [Bacillota bacterium]
MADSRHPSHPEAGEPRVPRWLLAVYVGIAAFFLYYVINFAILQPTHPEFGF